MIIIYHGSCCDGFCAAWLLSKLYPDAEFMPFHHGMKAPLDQIKDQDVIIADFCFPHDEMMALISQAKTLRVFDHHISVPLHLRELPFFVFDRNECGASLIWKHFESELIGKFCPSMLDAFSRRPWLVNYVRDRDLWLWQLPNSEEVNAGIRLAGWDFAEWDKLQFHKCLNEGVVIKKYRDMHVASAVKESFKVNVDVWDGEKEVRYVVPCVNETNGDFLSHVGEALASQSEDTPFGMTYFQRLNDEGFTEYVYSLRSKNGFDVSQIAKQFCGGGHAAAAGFTMGSLFMPAITGEAF